MIRYDHSNGSVSSLALSFVKFGNFLILVFVERTEYFQRSISRKSLEESGLCGHHDFTQPVARGGGQAVCRVCVGGGGEVLPYISNMATRILYFLTPLVA